MTYDAISLSTGMYIYAEVYVYVEVAKLFVQSNMLLPLSSCTVTPEEFFCIVPVQEDTVL